MSCLRRRSKEYDQLVWWASSDLDELWQVHRAVTHVDIESRVVKIVAEQLAVDEHFVTRHASFEDDLGADEFDKAELISLFESEFRQYEWLRLGGWRLGVLVFVLWRSFAGAGVDVVDHPLWEWNLDALLIKALFDAFS